MKNDLKKIFADVAEKNIWGDSDSLSGRGSNLEQTAIIRERIPILLKEYKIRNILDAPCGDLFWMKEILPELTKNNIEYTGADIVPVLIEKNSLKFANLPVNFFCFDLTKDIPGKQDLIFTRDCFIHLSYRNIHLILKNYKKSGSKYLLVNTYTNPARKNYNVNDHYITGRMLNLQKFPFFFPGPLEIINEGCTEGDGTEYADKSLGLWEIQRLNLWPLRVYVVYFEVTSLIRRIFLAIRRRISKLC